MTDARRRRQRRRFRLGPVLCGLALALASQLPAAAAFDATSVEPTQTADEPAAPATISDFTLSDIEGGAWSLSEQNDAPVIVAAFLGAECPLAQRYAPRLSELAARYAARGVRFVAIASNRQDSREDLQAYAKTHHLTIPLVKDEANRVADAFGAERTPEVFVLDAQRRVRYRGRIDDQMGIGYKRPAVQHDYVVEAIEDLLAGRPVRTPQTEAVGCLIGRQREPDVDSPVTYSEHIAPIFQRRCQDCHRPGEFAPFSLLTYEDALGWEAMIAEVVRQQRMPPWHARPGVGTFLNDKRLTDEEQQLIFEWVRRGAPQGDPAQTPPPRKFPDGWPIGQPDEVIYLAEEPYEVPATGRAKYQFFFVDPHFTEDKWVKWSWCRPDNHAVVHHINVYFRPPWESWNDWLGGIVNLISGYLPGQTIPDRPFDGTAIYVPAGSELLFEMHYTPNGPGQFDRSSLGLVYADPTEVTREAFHAAAFNSTFAIPPGAADFPVEAHYQTTQDVRLEFMSPHMHLRGKTFFYEAQYPDGRSEPLLDVQGYDYDWQTVYWMARPQTLPLGTRVQCRATFDNSTGNLRNPDPRATVRWSGYTEDEMMVGVLGLSVPISQAQATAGRSPEAAAQRTFASSTAPRWPGDKSVDRAIFLQNRREFPAARKHLQNAVAEYRQQISAGEGGRAPYRGLARVGWLKLQGFVKFRRVWLAGYLAAVNAAMAALLLYDRRAQTKGARRVPLTVQRCVALCGGSPAAWLLRYWPWPRLASTKSLRLWPIVIAQATACGACLWLVIRYQ